jgi:hypothetical protein
MPEVVHLKARDFVAQAPVATIPEFRVMTREELVEALHRKTPFVIGDKRLARPFETLLWAREARLWLLGGTALFLLGYALWLSNRFEFRHTEWRVNRTIQDKIILTPTTTPRRPTPTGEEWL